MKEPICDKCGAPMKLREPRADQTWKPFFGCSTYPACTNTRRAEDVERQEPFLFDETPLFESEDEPLFPEDPKDEDVPYLDEDDVPF